MIRIVAIMNQFRCLNHLQGEDYDGKADVWSAGVVFFGLAVASFDIERWPFYNPAKPRAFLRNILTDEPRFVMPSYSTTWSHPLILSAAGPCSQRTRRSRCACYWPPCSARTPRAGPPQPEWHPSSSKSRRRCEGDIVLGVVDTAALSPE